MSQTFFGVHAAGGLRSGHFVSPFLLRGLAGGLAGGLRSFHVDRQCRSTYPFRFPNRSEGVEFLDRIRISAIES